MKKQISLALAVIAGFFMVSCNEDDEPKFEKIDPMAGEWQLEKVGTILSGAVYYTAVENCASTLSFEGDTFIEVDSELVDEVCQSQTFGGSYAIENGNLVRTYDDATQHTDDIITLSDVQLELVHSDPETNALTFYRYRRM
jgi:hypothetical protein